MTDMTTREAGGQFNSSLLRNEWARARLGRRRLLGLAAAGSTLLLLGRPGRARAAPVSTTLSNGMRIVVEERPSSLTVAVRLVASVGSRDDGDLPGLSIFTLSMSLSTNKRPGTVALRRDVSAVGGAISFNTQSENSFYAARMPAGEVNVGFDVIADMVKTPDFDPFAVSSIARYMIQAQGQFRSDPSYLLDEIYGEQVFEGHPLSIPTWGNDESLRAIDFRALQAHRRRYFGASNLALAVVGKIRAADAIDVAERYFAEHFSGMPNLRTPVPPPQHPSLRTAQAEGGGQQALVRMGFATPGLSSPDFYPLWLLDTMMSGAPGRLFRAVRGQRGLAYSADSTYFAYSDAGTWYVTAGVDPRNVEATLEVIRGELELLRSTPPSPAELADTVEQLVGQLLLYEESNASRASELASAMLTGQPDTPETIDRLRTVTPLDLQRVAQTYLDPSKAILALVSPN
jgi:zinc protease